MSKYQQYAMKYAEYAMEHMRRYGIPASVTLAQGIDVYKRQKQTMRLCESVLNVRTE